MLAPYCNAIIIVRGEFNDAKSNDSPGSTPSWAHIPKPSPQNAPSAAFIELMLTGVAEIAEKHKGPTQYLKQQLASVSATNDFAQWQLF